MATRLNGTKGNDRLTLTDVPWNTGNASLYGYEGNDTLEGSFWNDSFIYGGSGNDHITGGRQQNFIWGDDGDDTINSWLTFERVELYGGRGNDALQAGSGGSILDGGIGADVLRGGDGADIFVVNDQRDVIIEAFAPNFDNELNPIDIVRSSVSWTLGSNLENLELQGSAHLRGAGNQFANKLTGNAGNNTLDGGTAADTLLGGAGNDILIGGSGSDRLEGGIGSDTASYVTSNSAVVVNLLNPRANTGDARGDLYVSIENATGSNYTDNLTGNTLNNVLSGLGGNDVLNGLGGHDKLLGGVGNDRLIGGAGNDTLNGQAGADQLIGGAGADTLTGGAGADVFVFNVVGESKGTTTDLITDFSKIDLIDLRKIDADVTVAKNQAFDFIGAEGFSGNAGELRFVVSGKSTSVTGDINGDGMSDFMIRLAGSHVLQADDFLL